MNLFTLLAFYALAGIGCAAAALVVRRASLLDAVLLLALWPLAGPFLLMREAPAADAPGSREIAFLLALRRAGETQLGALLPDQATARALAARLRVAAAKTAEIDMLLARPEFDEAEAQSRLLALRARSASEQAIATTTMRLQNIRRLRALRNRFANELDEVGELLVQLTTQAEVVRLAGVAEPSSAELVRELVSRIEGLDQMLDDDPHAICP